MIAIFLSPIPSISFNLSMLFSSMSKDSSANFSTIFFAVTGPIPEITPEAKYLSIPIAVFGRVSSHNSTLNCSPN